MESRGCLVRLVCTSAPLRPAPLTHRSLQQLLVFYLNGVATTVFPFLAANTDTGTVVLGSRGGASFFNGSMAQASFFRVPIGPQHVLLAISQGFPVPADTSNPLNGPNMMDCLNFGTRVDTVAGDGKFACSCAGTGYLGDNCQTPPPPTAHYLFDVDSCCVSYALMHCRAVWRMQRTSAHPSASPTQRARRTGLV